MIAHIAIALSLTLAAPTARAELPLPGTTVKYDERAGDPVRLSAFGLGNTSAYVRARAGDAFARQQGMSEAAVSPGGATVAAVPKSYRSGYDSVLLTDRAGGQTRRVRTVRKPLTASYVSWSRDGTRLALTVEQKVGGRWQAVGFTVVDVAAATARTVRVSGLSRGAGFWWTPDGNLVATYGTGLRLYRVADGMVLRTFAGVGLPTGPEDSFSPSGKRMAMWCPPRFTEQLCVADTGTGKIVQRVAVRPEALFGWWDDSHVIAVMAHQGAYRLAVLDLNGKVTRVLAAIPARTWAQELWLSFTRT
ncbi:TolB family protein [Nonomuraea sp. LPB2021202275-12-8]|uniref:TolB family protein n=1 Tax=Nonomuraea sp. LPB2021202275-12-8 TaxID=3120159 RepID=UPI00300C7867